MSCFTLTIFLRAFSGRFLSRGSATLGLILFSSVMVFAASPPAQPHLLWKQLPTLPDAEGFASAFAGVSGGALLVGGGANFPAGRPWDGGQKKWYDVVFVLKPGANRWDEAGRLPRPIAYGVSVSTSRGVICAGGGDAREHFRDVFLLTWNGSMLDTKKLPDLPASSAFGCGATVGNSFYLAGGIEKPDSLSAQNTFWRLDINAGAGTWENLPPCPGAGRMLAQAASVGQTFFLCGGVSLSAGPDGKAERTYLRDAYSYEEKNGWTRLADMPHGVAAAPSPMPVSNTGEVYLISGDDGSRTHLVGPDHPGFLQEVLVYDTVSARWKKAEADAPISRATAPTAKWNNLWVVASGERKPGYRSPEVWGLEISP